ncbi:type II toxin-antitoxin system RelE/ParE family toxin [Gammaproteobacteria bacterium]|nr:type II toxin-antitoxin system RelE/ParE family toxin [Gammaproteobacteria bacterium]MDC0598440.1 type II toxin-antitoxin system RelE/ParE family toxin [Gammaproteobacteria bacterium]
MLAFRLTAKAKNDLKKIARYTEGTWGKNQRNIYLKEIDNTFHLLSDTPSLGIECNFIRENYKKFPQGSHIIFYRSGSISKIEIIRILHKNMDVFSKFQGHA